MTMALPNYENNFFSVLPPTPNLETIVKPMKQNLKLFSVSLQTYVAPTRVSKKQKPDRKLQLHQFSSNFQNFKSC
jgi:hypothetical protein